jgi:hypothetical protein
MIKTPPEEAYSLFSQGHRDVTWKLRLYDLKGREVGWANYFEASYSVDKDAPNADSLMDALSDRDEFRRHARPSDDNPFDEVILPIENPEVALNRVGSAMVEAGLVESYDVVDNE